MCMKSMLKVVFKSFIMLTLFFTGSLVIGQKFLYTYAQNVEPKFMLSGGNITGLCHDIIQKLNEELAGQGIRIEYKSKELKSISEIFDALSKNEIQIFVGAAYSKERESYTTYLQPPLYGLREMFIINSNESKKFDKRQYVRIGVIGGTVTSESLPSIALRQEVVPFKNITEAIKALERKEIDTVFYSSLTLGYMLKNSKGKFETLKVPSEKYYHYIVLSKSVSKDVASKLENALERLNKNAVVKALIKKYDLDDFVVPGNVVEILTVDWKPYEWYDTTKKEWVGVDVDVVRAVLSKMGYEATFLTFPWTRCVELMKIGAYDGIMSLRVTQERLAFLSFPEEPLSTGKDVLFKLKNSKIKLSRLEHIPNSALCGYTEGYAYGDWFWNAKFKKIAVPDDVTGFKLLKSERIQLFVCNLIVGNELAKELDVDVEHSPVFGEKMIYYLAFSKNYQGSYLSNVFSQRLKEFKLTNDYLRILKRYGITYDDFWR
uniref:Transporter substrate-binding domain-containing protein n=1 Tax=Fervidobacterium pennivorans TaxID=93466 RepID=A0A7V4KCD0_FERPE